MTAGLTEIHDRAVTPRPFTVVGGFLGAGKTTLVNHLLRESSGRRYAVLVNDFGAINVDAALISAHDGQTMALTNGCICCSMSDGFVQAMLRLMSDPTSFDHVIVETSGVAEPDRIMDFARLDPLLSPDAILTLVDAEKVLHHLADDRVCDPVAQQIEQADLLLLNKIDLASPALLDEVVDRLRRLNPRAMILRCQDADLSSEILLGTALTGQSTGPCLQEPHYHRQHEREFFTVLIRESGPILRADFTEWASKIPKEVLRGKGWVEVVNEGSFVWQRVGGQNSLTASGGAPRGTELVLIATTPVEILPMLSSLSNPDRTD